MKFLFFALLLVVSTNCSGEQLPEFLNPLWHCKIPTGFLQLIRLNNTWNYIWLSNVRIMVAPVQNMSVIFDYMRDIIMSNQTNNPNPVNVTKPDALRLIGPDEIKFTGFNMGVRTIVKGTWLNAKGKKTKNYFISDLPCEQLDTTFIQFLDYDTNDSLFNALRETYEEIS